MGDWIRADKMLPRVGHDVLVYRREDFDVLYAIARIEESESGEAYWESENDIVHGMSVNYVTHWMELPDEPSLD